MVQILYLRNMTTTTTCFEYGMLISNSLQDVLNPMSKKQLAALISVAAKYGNVATVQALLDAIEKTEHLVCQ